MSKPSIVCLMGPTASGKTGLAIELHERLACDIVSVDSAMVFCGMDIGTATPTEEELARAPHRLINICDPAENYSAGRFCEDALREINNIHAQGRTPLLVGGTMLYFNLLQRGFLQFPGADAEIRASLQEKAAKNGWESLHAELTNIDPESAKRIHPNDPQRVSRALELFYSTGKTMTQLQEEQEWQELPFNIINLIISPQERSILHQRVEKRFDLMLAAGLVDEVKKLYERDDLNSSLPSIRMVGYRQMWSYLEGEYDFDTMRERSIIATRQLAKRQFTWLKRWENAIKLDTDDPELTEKTISHLTSALSPND
jgi:tRNA dimethylallyltransferase